MPKPAAGFLLPVLAAFAAPAPPQTDAQALLEKAKPALVRVIAYDREGKQLRQGEGFFAAKQGDVITARRVLEGATSAEVVSGKHYPVKGVIAESVSAGLVRLAVEVPEGEVSALELQEIQPEPKQPVVVAGAGTAGMVLSVRDEPGFGNILRITAPLSAEDWGAPVLNAKGEAIGIALWQAPPLKDASFAVSGEAVLDWPVSPPRTLADWSASDSHSIAAAEADYRSGLNKMFLGDYEGALALFEQAIRKNPRYAEAWFHAGFVKGKLGQTKEKIEAYRKAVEIKPNYGAAHYSLGVSYALGGRGELAIAEQKALETVDPTLAGKLQVLIHFILGGEHRHEEPADPAPAPGQRQLL